MPKNVFIIAEAGVNHNGELSKAFNLIDQAVECRANCIKFQTYITENIVTHSSPKANYQNKSIGKAKTHYEMLQEYEISIDDHYKLLTYAKQKKIKFLSSPFDIPSIELIHKLGIDTYKVPSGEITNLPYLQKVGSYNKQIILSTGMSHMEEIHAALNVIIKAGTKREKITLLHCITEYPASFKNVNLNVMATLRNEFKLNVGLSDHTLGIEVPIAAVALGATIIEKHFTLDKNLPGPDHQASLEPRNFAQMVNAIRNIELALGSTQKRPTLKERKNIYIVRKSIVASKNIHKGELLTKNNISTKRPGTGISPMQFNDLLGKKAQYNFKKDQLIKT